MKRQRLNVIRMEMLGAKVVPALSGQRTLKEAVDEALAAWIANPDTFYVLGSGSRPASLSHDGPSFSGRHRL